jgi:hypothetical protein
MADGRPLGVAVPAALVLLVAPKCPLCVAAWLGAFGVGAGAASFVATSLRPVAVVSLALALGMAVWRRKNSGCATRRPPP